MHRARRWELVRRRLLSRLLAEVMGGSCARMVIAAAALPPPPHRIALVGSGDITLGSLLLEGGNGNWRADRPPGAATDRHSPELLQIAVAQLLVVGHIKIRASNATILNTSEYVLAWLVGSKGMHFERPEILGKFRHAVAALDKTAVVTELIAAATREAFFPGTTCVLAAEAELFWRAMRSAVEETGSGAYPQLVPNGHKVVRTSDLHRIRNAHAALARRGLKAESEALVGLDQVITIAFERQRQAGYGCSHAYLCAD